MNKFLLKITLSFTLLLAITMPVFASEQLPTPQNTASVLATDQTYTEWPVQKDVPVNKVWSIKLSSPILASTVNDQNIYVVDSSSQHQNVKVSLAADTKTIQVTPLGNYRSGESYTLYILKPVASAPPNSISLKNSIRMQFTVVNVEPTIGSISVNYIDVGQGDSILIQTSTGKNILIDGGETDQTATVENYLHSAGVTTLDYVIATHADSDHIGSLDSVIKDFNIGKVYMPNVTNTTYTFEDLLSAMQSKGLTFSRAKAGGTLEFGAGLEADFVGPVEDSYTDANNYSAVLRLKHGSTSFLFTGDAETESESDMIASGVSLQSTVLKVGHHGSSSSTSEAFLNAVNPKYAVITVGPNSYGHPTEDVLNRLSQHGVSVFRTDVSGSIVATSDGTDVTFNTTPTPPITPPVSSNSVKITNVDLSAEIATISNTGTSTVDLTGWKLVSEQGSQTFAFPSGTTIQAGGTLKIVSGPNATTGTNTLLWTKSNMWNNSGDPATLYDSQGQVLSRYPQ